MTYVVLGGALNPIHSLLSVELHQVLKNQIKEFNVLVSGVSYLEESVIVSPVSSVSIQKVKLSSSLIHCRE